MNASCEEMNEENRRESSGERSSRGAGARGGLEGGRERESPEGPLVAQLSHLPIGPSHVLICLLVNPASLLSFISFLPFVEPSAPPLPLQSAPPAPLAFFCPPRPSLVLEIVAPIETRVCYGNRRSCSECLMKVSDAGNFGEWN